MELDKTTAGGNRTLSGFKVENEAVDYRSVFPFPIRKCASYLKNKREAVLQGKLQENESVNKACVENELTSYLRNGNRSKALKLIQQQDVPAFMMALQAKAILNFPFMQHVLDNYKALPGYRLQRWIMMAILKFCCARCPDHIVLGHGSYPEIQLSATAFASDMGYFNLYDVLGEGYPIYHAEMTRRIPTYIADHADELLEKKAGRINSPVEYLVWGKERRFAGLYPVIEVPEEYLTPDSPWVSQDQLARKEIANNIFKQALETLRKNPEKNIYVVDFGGGVGNLGELLLKKIYSMPDSDAQMRALLKKRVRVIVRDLSNQQLQAGLKRFMKMAFSKNGLNLAGISENICFMQSDITKKLEASDQIKYLGKSPTETFKSKWPDFDLSNSVVFGMSAYAFGAIPSAVIEKAALEIHRLCSKFYAVDFSSPMWRMQGFLNDTGSLGKAYLRALHGKTENLRDSILNPHVKFMALSPGLASQYATWNGVDGHNAGYTINLDGTLIPPNILTVTKTFHRLNSKKISYRSKVRFYTFLYLGHTVSGNVALACVPGWIADYLSVE